MKKTAMRTVAGLALLMSFTDIQQLDEPAELIEGIIWQPTNDYPVPQGNWHLIGADTLLVQWSLNDSLSWVPTEEFEIQPAPPDWTALRREPWAERLILGLSSRMQLEDSRRDWALLASEGERLQASLDGRFGVDGWYAPIEFSPDWINNDAYLAYLASLPRPRYVSAYGGYDMEAGAFADWVEGWLPDDATLLYQDGVGVGRQTPEQARARADVLIDRLGEDRVVMVLEAFQPDGQAGVGPASLTQLVHQLRAYRGLRLYVFAARHLSTQQVVALRLLSPWL